MNTNTLFGIAGGGLGMLAWFGMLESEKMTGVLFRSNDKGEKVFTPYNALLYIAAPFKYGFFWTAEFFVHNWIIMVASCAGLGYAIGSFFM